jgi:leucyl-tRNA synthetase
LGNKKSIFETEWPKYDEKLIKKDKIDLIVQINGKVRDKINVNVDISEKEAKELVLSSDKIKSWLNNQELKKIIFVKGKLINIVI